MTGSRWGRAAGRTGQGSSSLRLAQAGTLGSLLFVLFSTACDDTTRGTPENSASDGGAGSGGDGSGSGSGGSSCGESCGVGGGSGGTSAAVAGGAGETNQPDPVGGAAGAGEPGDECQPTAEVPVDDCEYPESLGGAGDPARCGVTPAAWYPLGDSELTAWPEPAAWLPTSGWGPIAYPTNDPEIAFDAEGRLVVAWLHEDGIEIRRWNDSEWEVLAAGAPTPLDVKDFEMVLDEAGNPVVAAYGSSMRVLQWRDESWVSLGLWAAPATHAAEIVLDAEGLPVVAYVDNGRLFAKRWNGSSFQDLAGDAADGSLSDRARWVSKPAVALRQNGDIVVAWTDTLVEASDYSVYATLHLQWSGERWEPLGASATLSSDVDVYYDEVESDPAVAVDGDDRVIVAWEDEGGALRVWDGTEWSPEAAGPDRPRLLEDMEGSVYLAGDLDHLELWQWQSGEWTPAAIPLFYRYGREPGLAVGDDGRLAVARPETTWDQLQLLVTEDGEWHELGEPAARSEGLGSADAQLVSLSNGLFLLGEDCRVERWDGQDWQALDLSNWVGSLGDCRHSTLTESLTGQLVLGLWIRELEDPNYQYDMGDAPDYQLYLLGWTDAGWEQLAAPFAHNGFVVDPKIAFDSGGTPVVAWSEYTEAGGHPIWVLAWNGTAWDRVGDLFAYDGNLELLMLPDDRMVLAWKDEWDVEGGALYEAGEWKELGTLARPGVAALKLVQDAKGTPFLTWPSADSLALYELSGSSWQPVPADERRLATLPEHVRMHAFEDSGEVYLRRFENCGWRGLSASDRDGGVSNSETPSEAPSFALHDGSTCVSWMERSELASVELVRCHD